jgi:hypothetical protein
MSLIEIYTQLGILFSLMFIGYILGKIEILKEESIKSFTSFIVKIAMPMLIVDGMLIPFTPDKIQLVFTTLLLSIGVYIVTYFFGRLVTPLLTKSPDRASVYLFCIMFSNVGFMGYPVLKAIFGEEAIFIASIYNITFNVLLYTLGVYIIQGKSNEKMSLTRNLRKIFLNPGTLASIIGLFLFFTRIALPSFMLGTIKSLGSTCTPLAMITIGAMLSSISAKEVFKNKEVYLLTMLRLVVIPGLVLLIFKYILQVDTMLLIGIPVVVAGMPVATNAAMMIKEYGKDSKLASQCILFTTIVSGITIPLLARLI